MTASRNDVIFAVKSSFRNLYSQEFPEHRCILEGLNLGLMSCCPARQSLNCKVNKKKFHVVFDFSTSL